ncbi:MAG: GvpL/GvpF family gas vesicle protein [Pseudomonadota bacterium]
MTALYCYGMIEGHEPLPDLGPGIGDEDQVTGLAIEDHTAIVSPTTAAEIPARRRQLRRHTQILEQAASSRTILPMRFGTIAASAEALVEALSPRQGEIATLMTRFQAHAEYGLRIALPAAALMRLALEANPWIARQHQALHRRNALHGTAQIDFGRRVGDAVGAARRHAARKIDRTIAPLITEAHRHAPEGEEEILRMDLLVHDEKLPDLNRALNVLTETPLGEAQPQIRLVGPVPPYSFIDLRLTVDAASIRQNGRAA